MNKVIMFFVLAQFLIINVEGKTNNKYRDTIGVLHTVLDQFDSLCLDKNTYYGHTSVTPIYVINNYLRVYDSSKESAAYYLFYKEIDGVITKEELEKIKKSNLEWKRKTWDRKDISNPNISLIQGPENRDQCQKRYMKIAEPVFTKDGKKAMVFISSSKSKNSGSSSYVKILEKEDDKWQIKGSIPVGVGD